MIWENKKITMMGLGILGRGVGVAEFLAERGVDLIITDLKNKKELQSSLNKLKKYKNIKYVLGKHRISDFKDRDLIIKAAGVPLDSIYINEAKKHKIPVEMDASLFAKLANVRIIGITGTRGKSTVTHLLDNILKKDARRVFLGGNVRGLATLPLLDKIKKGDLVLMELDSWQLQGFGEAKISPSVSVFINFLDDHLNYYKGDKKRYFNDKANIFCYQKKEDCLIVSHQANEAIKKYFKGKIKSEILIVNGSDMPSKWKTRILGKHNLRNTVLAIKVAQVLGVKEEIIRKAVEEFKGVPGRLELIRELKGVKYYNDTTSTMPDATVAALKSFLPEKSCESNIVLIGGGADKFLDYKDFVRELDGRVKVLILFKGAATDKITREIKRTEFNCEHGVEEVNNMKNALKLVNKYAKKGDIVLLSPGAASFGIFKNEFDRGDQFCKAIKELK